jgi:Tfp pilus assembly major pilin PilA
MTRTSNCSALRMSLKLKKLSSTMSRTAGTQQRRAASLQTSSGYATKGYCATTGKTCTRDSSIPLKI